MTTKQTALDSYFDLKEILDSVPMTVAQRRRVGSKLKNIKAELEKPEVKACEC
mgnify:CR=1 FL=1